MDHHSHPIGDEVGSDEELELRLRKYEEYISDNRQELARLHSITAEMENRMKEAEEEHRQLLEAYQKSKDRRASGQQVSVNDHRGLPDDGDIQHLQEEMEWTRQRMEELQMKLAKSNAHREQRRSERSESETAIQVTQIDREDEALYESVGNKTAGSPAENHHEAESQRQTETQNETETENQAETQNGVETQNESGEEQVHVMEGEEKAEVHENGVEPEVEQAGEDPQAEVETNGTTPEDGASAEVDERATLPATTENRELTTEITAAEGEQIVQVTKVDRDGDGNIDEVVVSYTTVDEQGKQVHVEEVLYEDPPQRAKKISDTPIYQNIPADMNEPAPDYDDEEATPTTTTTTYVIKEPTPVANGGAPGRTKMSNSARIQKQMAAMKRELASSGTKLTDADLARIATQLSDNKAPTRTLKQIRQGNTKTRVSIFEQL